MPQSRQFDIVLFGATGFTGGLTAEYLARSAPKKIRWALAGRNPGKLESVRRRLAEINPACADLDLIEVDAADADALRVLAGNARVVASTVGPFIQYGEPLVAACAAAGTHYADITGEPEFVDLMWLNHHATAQASGAKIVHCCGFDSIPHDLGAYHAVQQLPPGVPIRLEGFVSAGGEFSGGTFHSAVNAFARLREYGRVRARRRQVEGRPPGRKIGGTSGRLRYVDAIKAWAVPFPSIDGQVVRRSAAGLERYGPQFRYGHFLRIKTLPTAAALVAGAGALFSLAQFGPTRRWILGRKAPGAGPTPEKRAESWFRVRFVGLGGGMRVVTEVSGGDPGYTETAKMLAESAMCLAVDKLPPLAGQLTTAVAMGDALTGRLQKAGILFTVVESSDLSAP